MSIFFWVVYLVLWEISTTMPPWIESFCTHIVPVMNIFIIIIILSANAAKVAFRDCTESCIFPLEYSISTNNTIDYVSLSSAFQISFDLKLVSENFLYLFCFTLTIIIIIIVIIINIICSGDLLRRLPISLISIRCLRVLACYHSLWNQARTCCKFITKAVRLVY